MASKASGIDEYLAGVSNEQREVLETLRRRIRKAVPDASESISYGIPTFRYRRRPLLYFAAFKDHCSLYPCTDGMLKVGGDDVARRRTGKGTIRFTIDDPLPDSLVKKLVKVRIEEIDSA